MAQRIMKTFGETRSGKHSCGEKYRRRNVTVGETSFGETSFGETTLTTFRGNNFRWKDVQGNCIRGTDIEPKNLIALAIGGRICKKMFSSTNIHIYIITLILANTTASKQVEIWSVSGISTMQCVCTVLGETTYLSWLCSKMDMTTHYKDRNNGKALCTNIPTYIDRRVARNWWESWS
jgi:hypothetical protein